MIILAASIPITEPHPLSLLPFAALLLCIAFLPFVLKHHWERHYHLIALFLAATTTAYYLFGIRRAEPILRECADYIRFMALVGSLFIVAGVIANLHIYFQPTSLFNTLVMLVLLVGGLGLIAAGVVRPPKRTTRSRPAQRIKSKGSVSDLVAEQRR